jgi:hypothetical protein
MGPASDQISPSAEIGVQVQEHVQASQHSGNMKTSPVIITEEVKSLCEGGLRKLAHVRPPIPQVFTGVYKEWERRFPTYVKAADRESKGIPTLDGFQSDLNQILTEKELVIVNTTSIVFAAILEVISSEQCTNISHDLLDIYGNPCSIKALACLTALLNDASLDWEPIFRELVEELGKDAMRFQLLLSKIIKPVLISETRKNTEKARRNSEPKLIAEHFKKLAGFDYVVRYARILYEKFVATMSKEADLPVNMKAVMCSILKSICKKNRYCDEQDSHI